MSPGNLFRRMMTRSLSRRNAAQYRKPVRHVGRRIEELEDRSVPATYTWTNSNTLLLALGTNESLGVVQQGTSPNLSFTLSGGTDTWMQSGGNPTDGTNSGSVL